MIFDCNANAKVFQNENFGCMEVCRCAGQCVSLGMPKCSLDGSCRWQVGDKHLADWHPAHRWLWTSSQLDDVKLSA